MRINHNISALNTYRSIVTNNTNTSKSLEKLSSGLRINRAGDDAAGLAISEKMRGQIRGLNQAERNAQDGISMLQTAEGALSEIHSILQRIKELATQAASDTNVAVDRDEIQKEINQLTSEVNRIGNSAEFNTQKLLDGGMLKTAVTTQTKGLAVTQGAAASTTNTASVKAIGFWAEVGTESTQAVEATYTMLVTAGNTITIHGHEDNGAAANALKIRFASSGEAGAASAALAGDTLTISLGTGANDNELADIEAAIQGAGGNWAALGIDKTKITVTGAANLGAVASAATILDPAEAATALTGGVTEVRGVYNFELTEDYLATLEVGDSISIGGVNFTAVAGVANAANQEFNITAGDTEATLTSIKTAVDNAAANLVGAAGSYASSRTGNVLTLREELGEATGTDLTDATIEVDQTAGDYTLEITKLFKAGEQITFGGQTFKAVASGATAANGQFLAGTTIESQTESLKAAIEATLGGRFTVTLDDDTLNLVEKTMRATGEDLAITKTGNVQGSVSFRNTAQGSLGTAAVWNSGAIVALADDSTGTFSFNGVTVNLTTGAVDGPTVDAAAKSVSVSIANGSDAAATATAIQDALAAYQNGAGNELDDFVFAVDDAATGITITGVTDAATGIATYGDDYDNLVIGGTIEIGNTSNLAQLTTHGADSRKATYTFDITAAFKANEAIEIAGRQFLGVEGEANALLGEFSISGSKTDQAESLRAAIEATPTLSNRYDVTVSGSKITLAEKVAGQEVEALAAPTTELTKGTTGVYSFKAQVVNAGQAYKIDGVSISVVNDAEKYREEIAAGTAILAAANATEQAENLRTAINVNEALNAKYIAEGTGDTIKLTQQEGAESATDPVISVENQGANGKFVANFQIGANTGQSMTIEIGDIRSVALKISGTESGTSISAKNGVEASFVAVANVSNGTDNTSVEYSLDVSDHTKASAAVSVIQDAIDAVSAQRSQMGAYQNRLEHTINNLGTSAENLTAAESRIRDVDMAKEMMEFTKNNILSQAAQAMLAQANQQPQAVLQLLQ